MDVLFAIGTIFGKVFTAFRSVNTYFGISFFDYFLGMSIVVIALKFFTRSTGQRNSGESMLNERFVPKSEYRDMSRRGRAYYTSRRADAVATSISNNKARGWRS